MKNEKKPSLSIPLTDFPLDAKHFEELAKKLDYTYRRYEKTLKKIFEQNEKRN